MYAVIRRYGNAKALIDEMARKPQDIERMMSGVPGFVAYHAVRDGDTVVTISICRDREGTTETTRRAAQWVRENVAGGSVGAPEIVEGETFINFGAPQPTGTGA